MLGKDRQPWCGKCCGEHTKEGNAKQKRAQRRVDKIDVEQTRRVVSLLTGLSYEELEELGGFDND